MKKTYCITTPIYYPSASLHLGNAYPTVIADVMARYKRMCGYDVFYMTGTDEHGMKIEDAAKKAGVEPKTFVDNIVAGVRDLWKTLDITFDKYIRTTDDYHEKTVQSIFQKLYDQGDIYKGYYEGHYCTPCESYWTDTQLVNGKCPDCGRDVQLTKEESYFLRISKYQQQLIDYIEAHPEFIQPKSRLNEMMNNFIKPGLEDLSVSRTSFTWGIKVPFDEKHVIYVWMDALSNYISGLGYMGDSKRMESFWPADLHLVGKEIVRFHVIIWPIMLMMLGLPLPKQIYGHGWWTSEGMKMSKSMGNVVDPIEYSNRYGRDAFRYFLCREMTIGADGDFSHKGFLTRINSDLANDLGNLLSRTTAMCLKYFGGVLPSEKEREIADIDEEISALAEETFGLYKSDMDELKLSSALTEIWKLCSRANKYIDETQPWMLCKDETQKMRLASVMYNLCEALRMIAVMLAPFMPSTSEGILNQLGLQKATAVTDLKWQTNTPFNPTKGENLFPRIDIEADMKRVDEEKASKHAAESKTTGDGEKEAAELITIDDFYKIKLVVAKILECEPVPKSDKLLRMIVDIGNETRQVVSGIAKWYKPEDLIGRKVTFIANLQTAKLRGVESQGMILASGEEDVKVVFIDDSVGIGEEIR